MGIKSLSLGRTDITYLDPHILRIDPTFNEREDTPDYRAALEDLKGQIKAQGVLVPIVLRRNKPGQDGYVVVDGHRRMACVNALLDEGLEIKSVPTRFEPDGTNDADRVLSMVMLNSGQPFTPYEKAKVVKKAHGYGVSYEEISEKIGVSLTYINAVLLPLLESPQVILNEVKAGKVSAALAVQVQKDCPADAPQVLQEAGEIAQATGAAKTTPKHVKAAMEAREAFTDEHPEPKRKHFDWPKLGPAMKKAIEKAINEPDQGKALAGLLKFHQTAFGE